MLSACQKERRMGSTGVGSRDGSVRFGAGAGLAAVGSGLPAVFLLEQVGAETHGALASDRQISRSGRQFWPPAASSLGQPPALTGSCSRPRASLSHERDASS